MRGLALAQAKGSRIKHVSGCECEDKGLLAKAPSYNSVFRYLERADLAPLLKTLVHESAAPRGRDHVRDRLHRLRDEHLCALVRREVWPGGSAASAGSSCTRRSARPPRARSALLQLTSFAFVRSLPAPTGVSAGGADISAERCGETREITLTTFVRNREGSTCSHHRDRLAGIVR